jgi:short-subunit dehydrogenase
MRLSKREQQRLKQAYGDWAVITGASSGIGMSLSELIASCHINVILCSRSQEKLNTQASHLKKKYGIETKVIALDLSEAENIDALIQQTQGITISLFVASAGFGTSGKFLQSSIHEEINMLRLNCEAVLRLTHYFMQHMVHRKKGGIILLSSIVAFQGVPYAAHYAATKAYLQSLAEGIQQEIKGLGVDVLAAIPGPVVSGFGQRANMQMGTALHPEEVAESILKALGKGNSVLPGLLSKVLVNSLRTAPRFLRIKIMETIMRGFTKHQVG